MEPETLNPTNAQPKPLNSQPRMQVPFDIFDRRFQASWEAVMHRFNDDVGQIEEATKTFINESFKKLRSLP